METENKECPFCKADANLVSDERHNNDISHKIISDIKQSKFVIADFTDQNNGVYFEAGYAMGESKEVIRLISKEQLDEKKLHFDTRQFHHIPWEKDKWKELREDLINQIKATIK
jgi:nucleoside 2-deoxyribosyltransferase